MASRTPALRAPERSDELATDVIELEAHPLLERGRRAPHPQAAPGSLDWRQAVGGALVALGFIATLVAWYGVSGTLDPGEQMPYISSGGFGGAALIALGVTLLVAYEHSRDRDALRAVLDELDAVRSRLESVDQDLQQLALREVTTTANGAASRASRPTRRPRATS
jgi:hypothetical protein